VGFVDIEKARKAKINNVESRPVRLVEGRCNADISGFHAVVHDAYSVNGRISVKLEGPTFELRSR
jgi:hypothetical protein